MIFNYSISKKENVDVFHLKGELIDRETPAAMLQFIKTEIEKGNNSIVLDLEHLKYINSSGLSLLITVLTKARKSGGDVAICSVNSKVAELLVITKLDSIFNVCKNVDDAVKLLNN